nr:putative transcription elongation factor SPT5 homolog 1 [Tanacetum cinerariifolium]
MLSKLLTVHARGDKGLLNIYIEEFWSYMIITIRNMQDLFVLNLNHTYWLVLVPMVIEISPGRGVPPLSGGRHRGGGRGGDSLAGRSIKIRLGPWKGYKGRVVDASGTTVRVELESQMKVVTGVVLATFAICLLLLPGYIIPGSSLQLIALT